MKDVDFAQHYHKSWHQDFLFRWVDRSKTKILKKDLDGKQLIVLDYGCGSASITSRIAGCELHGVDNNPSLLKIAKQRGVNVKNGDFEKLPYKDNTFDVVISIDTIEHVASREKAFGEIRRVLKPSGAFYVFTPAYNSPLWVMAEKVVNMITGRPSGHKSPFIKESLDYFMSENFRKYSKSKFINFTLGMYSIGKFKRR